MVKAKICGITNIEDANKAVYYGAWALGFIFYKKSPRYISPSKARRIVDQLPPFITPVGVFVNQKERAIKEVCRFANVSTIQLHGEEDANFCRRLKNFKIIKSFRVSDQFDFRVVKNYNVNAILFDTYQENQYGGTGKEFNWDVLADIKFDCPYILSGGLKSENLQEALSKLDPFAVDVSSGVEKSPGIKNPRSIRAFMETLSYANRQ